MASTNRTFTSFTITQPFLGAPLQFQPALGSQELEELIDAFVTGSASKQDKLSQVTIDFYTHATVDLNTGALVRRYDVALSSPWATTAYEQSPIQSQSSGFSPPMFTPSPASSATFGDSGYGSISMTPPTRNRGPRISKRAKKDTKKTAEVKLPGFSIMTKDGIDVTSTAGRGTKTKEQREHAHLMRIMKACDDCKRKKVRCDPSHRRSHNDMSRTSTKTSSSSRNNPSPSASVPSLSRETTNNSQESLPSFGTNPIDDFVLFPEDTWNLGDMSGFDSQVGDLGQFNFDINDMGMDNFASSGADQSLDFSFDQPMDFQQSNHNPLLADQYGLDSWASPFGDSSVPHSRPHPASSSQDSGQLDSSWYDSSPDGSFDFPELSLNTSAANIDPAFYPKDWSINDQSPANVAEPANQGLAGQSASGSRNQRHTPTSSVNLSSPSGQSSSGNRKQRRSLNRLNTAAIQQFVDSVPSLGARQPRSFVAATDQQHITPGYPPELSISPLDGGRESYSPNLDAIDISGVERLNVLLNNSLESFRSIPEYASVSADLHQLGDALSHVESLHTSGRNVVLTENDVATFQALTGHLKVLSSSALHDADSSGHQRHDESNPGLIRECQANARQLVRSLCATIASLQTQGPSPATGNLAVLSSGRNLQLLVPPFESHSPNRNTASSSDSEQLYSQSSTGFSSQTTAGDRTRYGVILREDGGKALLDAVHYYEEFEAGEEASGSFGSSTVAKNATHIDRRRVLISKTVNLLLEESNLGLEVWTSPSEDQATNSALVSLTTSQDLSFTGRTTQPRLQRRSPAQALQEEQRATPSTSSLLSQHLTQQSLYENVFGGSRIASPDTLHVRSVGSSQVASPSQTGEVVSRGAIPRSDLELLSLSSHAGVEARLATAALRLLGGYDVIYSVLVALTVIASFFVFQATPTLLAPLVLALAVLGVGHDQLQPTSSNLTIKGLALTLGLALWASTPLLAHLHKSVNAWIDASPSTFLPKLLFVCMAVASPSGVWKGVRAMGGCVPLVAAASLLRLSNDSCGESRRTLSDIFKGKEVRMWFERLTTTFVV